MAVGAHVLKSPVTPTTRRVPLNCLTLQFCAAFCVYLCFSGCLLQVLKAYPNNFRVDYALSREQKNKDGGKMYIQDKVAEYSDEIFERMDKVCC